MQGEHLGGRGGGRHHRHPAEVGQVAQDRVLETEVVGDDRPLARADRVRLRRGDLGHQVDAVGARFGERRGTQRCLGGSAECTSHGTRVAQQAGEATGVDATDTADAVVGQHRVQRRSGPVVAVPSGQVADDDSTAERTARLEVAGVHPVVADVRVGERDDLAGVGGIGDHLLIARQDGVEHHFTAGHPTGRFGADELAFEDASIGEDECCRADHDCHPSRMFMQSNA